MLFSWTAGEADLSMPELFPQFTDAKVYPSQRKLVDTYEAASGRTYRHDRFYRTLGGFKLTTALEAFYGRHLAGTASDPMYPQLEKAVPDLAARLQRIVDGDEPLA
jgi:aminoglycoside phosphotransferase (APT) family kinase protein